jgi:hypothetical protein
MGYNLGQAGPHLPIVEKIQITLSRPIRRGFIQTTGQPGRTTVCGYFITNKIKKDNGVISMISKWSTYPRKWDTWPHGGEANEDQ